MDEVAAFEEFFTAYGSVLKQQFDPSEKFYESVSSGLRQELETLSDNRQDRESDHQWVNDVESAAAKVGVIDDLRSAIESARESIEQHYADYEYPPSRPTSGAGNGFPRVDVSVSERVAIDGMFREHS